MNIESRPRRAPFDFVAAVTAMFQTTDGKAFAWRLLFWTTAALSVVMLISLPFILPHYGPLLDVNQQNMQAIMEGRTSSQADNDAILGALKGMILPGLLMTLGSWAAFASGEAALHRKVLRGEENARRPLGFGADELRVMLAQLGVWAAFFVIYIGGAIFIGLMAVIPVLGIILAILGFFFLFAMIIYIPVRLAPAAALSVKSKQAHLMSARRITKGRFWPLFGAYVVVFIGGYMLIYFVMITLLMIVTGDSNAVMSINGLGDTLPSEMMADAGERLKNPFFMVIGVLGVIVYSLAYASWMLSVAGIAAYAVKWWQEDDPIAPFD